MIFTDRTITVRKGESRIDEPIVVYRGDYELEVRFTILNSRFKFMSGVNMIESEKASYGQLAILTPYGGNIFSDIVRCNDGSVTFVLTAEMLNQIEEVGLYSFQIRLMDYNKESRVSIPPIEFGIEVREPIASEDHDNSVNNAIVGYSIAKVVDPKEENVGDTFNESGNYNKTKWKTGDRISEGKLNKIEDAIDKINENEVNNTAVLSRRIDNNFNVLDSIVDEINAQLLQMKRQGIVLLDGINGELEEGSCVSSDFIRNLQNINMSKFVQKIRNTDSGVTINCFGDSITYGYDNHSEDKRPPINGSIDYRASVTYPEKLSECLNIIYKGKVGVNNVGFPGMTTVTGYEKTKNVETVDCTIMMYGINNVVVPTDYQNDIKTFIEYYEQMIVRQILRGSFVILLTPTNMRDNGTQTIDSLGKSLYKLAEKYGITLLNTQEFMTGYDFNKIYSDDVHYNGVGYGILGSRIASVILSTSLQRKFDIGANDCLLTNPNLDNCVYNNFQIIGASSDLPLSSWQLLVKEGGYCTYSFYATTDNLIVCPNFYSFPEREVKMMLDFGVEQQDYTFDKSFDEYPSTLNNPAHTITIKNFSGDVNKNYCVENDKWFIHISKKGWHTITLHASKGDLALNGIEFFSWDFKKSTQSLNDIKNFGNIRIELYDKWYENPSIVTQTSIPLEKIKKKLGFEFWSIATTASFKLPALKITISSEGNTITEYAVFLSQNPGSEKVVEIATYNIGSDKKRTVTNVYPGSNHDLIIKYGESTNILSTVTLSLL